MDSPERTADSEEAELSRKLDDNPRSLPLLLRKGDLRAEAGDKDAAALLYRTALRIADEVEPPESVRPDIERARQRLAEMDSSADAMRDRRLTSRGIPAGERSPRLRKALDIAAGRSRLYHQEPTAFTYPELPQIQYYDPASFAWAAELEAAAPVMRQEFEQLMASAGDEFQPYIQSDAGAGPLGANRALLGSKDWSVLSFCHNGWVSPKLVERCPRTWEAVLKAPLPRIAGWGPTVTYSQLKAGAHIAAHTGMFNTRLICHLPLIVPSGCRFRVGNETREWQEGKLLIFDDTIEHEAWNDGPDDRIILIFDIWRPELSEREQYELMALFSD